MGYSKNGGQRKKVGDDHLKMYSSLEPLGFSGILCTVCISTVLVVL